ncbi:hypothetical protein ACUXQ2_000092 [Cupriavidus metallidurans]
MEEVGRAGGRETFELATTGVAATVHKDRMRQTL